jgi:phospholipid-binding lipoprotein MlaA
VTHAFRRFATLCLLVWMGVLAGCATGPDAHPADPLEPFNRGVHRFNEGVDEAVLKPVATAYRDVTPQPVRSGVHNFFGNLRDIWSFVNAVLQARPQEAAETFMRVNVNTFFGLGGVLDIATEMRLERHNLDLGQTLGRWGLPAGPYLVLPLMGPSTVRDATGQVVESQHDPVQGIDDIGSRNATTALKLVDTRANLLGAGRMLDEAALDKYSFTRDAYLQRRQSLVGEAQGKEDNE